MIPFLVTNDASSEEAFSSPNYPRIFSWSVSVSKFTQIDSVEPGGWGVIPNKYYLC